MATDSVTVSPTFNGDSTPLTAGMIVRLASANNNVVRALADTALHVQGVNGVVLSGSSAPRSAVLCACIGLGTVQMESGLTLVVGQTVYVSPNVAGKGTNVLPANVSAIGTIADISNYARLGTIKVDVNISAVTPASVSGVSSVTTQKPGDSTSPSTGAVVITGGGWARVANLTTLAALSAANFPIGNSFCWVDSVGAYFQLQISALTVDHITVETALGLAGAQWIRSSGQQNAKWQAQLAWSVDPQNTTGTASDENTGIDDAHALLTMRELGRRVVGSRYKNGQGAVIVRLLSSMNASDGAYFDVEGSGAVAFSSNTPFGSDSWFTIVGVPTVLYTGTIGAPAQTAQGGNGDNHFTDGGAPSFATANQIWHRTTGNGGYFWPMKDGGAGVRRVSVPIGTFQNVRTMVNGDVWQILGLPLVNNLGFPYRADGEAQYQIALVSENSTAFNAFINPARWVCVQFAVTSQLQAGTLNNCRDFFITFYANRPTYIASGGLLSTATGQTVFDIAEATSLGLNGGNNDYLSLQGVAMQPASSANIYGTGGTFTAFSASFYDLATTCIQPTGSGATVNAQHIGGLGCSGKIVDIERANNKVSFVSLPPAGITTDATPYEVMGISTATLPILDANLGISIVIFNDTANFLGAGVVSSNAAGKLTASTEATNGAVTVAITNAPTGSPAAPVRYVKLPDGIGGFYTVPSLT